jgi:adenylate cyclase
LSTAIGLFKKANQADPGFAPAYAYLAYSYYLTVIMGYAGEPEAQLQEGLAAANLALKHDDKDAIPYFAAGRIHMMLGDHDASIASLKKSIELNPCFAQSYHGLGFALALAGRLEEAKQTSRKAIELSPRDPMLWAFNVVHALTYVLNGENEEGLSWAQQAMQIPSASGYWSHAVKAASLANLDRTDEARIVLADAVKAKPDLTIAFLKENMPIKDENGLEPYLAGLRKAGLAES